MPSPTARIAIDFGTTRTKAAYLDPQTGRARMVMLGHGVPTLPSLFFLERGQPPLLGYEAEAWIEREPAGAVRVLKRRLREVRVRAGRTEISPTELLGLLLARIRQRVGEEVTAFGGVMPDEVVLTLPAAGSGAGPNVEKVMHDAAKEAGFAKVTLVSEPEAAALAYVRDAGAQAPDLLVVLDCGGGTVDWTCLQRREGRLVPMTECPPGGDDKVGGEFVDDELLAVVRARVDQSGDEAAATELERRQEALVGHLRGLRERFCLGRGRQVAAGDALHLGGLTVALGAEEVRLVVERRFVDQVCLGFGRYLESVRRHGGVAEPTVLLVGGAARMLGLREALQERCGCRPVGWEESDFAPVLGAAGVGVEGLRSAEDPMPREEDTVETAKPPTQKASVAVEEQPATDNPEALAKEPVIDERLPEMVALRQVPPQHKPAEGDDSTLTARASETPGKAAPRRRWMWIALVLVGATLLAHQAGRVLAEIMARVITQADASQTQWEREVETSVAEAAPAAAPAPAVVVDAAAAPVQQLVPTADVVERSVGESDVTVVPAEAAAPHGPVELSDAQKEAVKLASLAEKASTAKLRVLYLKKAIEKDPGERQYKTALRKAEADLEAQTPVVAKQAPDVAGPTVKINGHEWQRGDAERRMDWTEAKAYCAELNLAGGGWRLPTLEELKGLIDKGQPTSPSIVTALRATTPSAFSGYWSGAHALSALDQAWGVDFSWGNSYFYDDWRKNRVRCVR